MTEFDIEDLPGYLVEGTLKQDDGEWYVDRANIEARGPDKISLSSVFQRYEDKEIRFTLAGIAELAEFAQDYQEGPDDGKGTDS